jgi:hypothetical protein
MTEFAEGINVGGQVYHLPIDNSYQQIKETFCMLYQHSMEIQERLESVLVLIETGQYSTPALAKEVGVSIPTVSRIVAALRERGHDIRAEKNGNGWRYVLMRKVANRTSEISASRKGNRMSINNSLSD